MLSNFRPVSILDNFSKVYEKVFYSQLVDFFNSESILSNSQFGFRANRGTSQAISVFLSDLYSTLDEGNYFFAMFLDFKKAFDCVNHEILLSKLEFYGVRGVPLQWIRSYLAQRKQYTVVNGRSSKLCNLSYGVPQGSILGPLLFLIYINDFPISSSYFKFNLFADDSTISSSFPRSRIHEIHLEINKNLVQISNWLENNRIMINVEKTKFIVFSYRGTISIQSVYINNRLIENVNCIKYLGCYIDNNVSFSEHIRISYI